MVLLNNGSGKGLVILVVTKLYIKAFASSLSVSISSGCTVGSNTRMIKETNTLYPKNKQCSEYLMPESSQKIKIKVMMFSCG